MEKIVLDAKMAYLDTKIKVLVKAQEKAVRAATAISHKRSVAHNNIERTLARAILRGGYLSQEVWILTNEWTENLTNRSFSLSLHAPTGRPFKKRWNNILVYMEKYSYRVELAPDIYLTYREGDNINLAAEDQKDLAIFVQKQGIQIICPEVDDVVDTLERRLEFVKSIRSSLQLT